MRIGSQTTLSTGAVLRLALVRFGASFLLILTTGILNRILITELRMAAWVVTLVLSFQHLTSPFALGAGHLSDRSPLWGRRRVPYIRLWTIIAGLTVPFMPVVALKMSTGLGWLFFGALIFGLFGYGLKVANILVGALIADRTSDPLIRGRQLNVIWVMAIVGFIVAGLVYAHGIPAYDPTSTEDLNRLQWLCIGTSVLAVILAFVGTWRMEERLDHVTPSSIAAKSTDLSMLQTLRAVMKRPGVRRTFAFLMVADFSFFIQEFVLESFGGDVFDMSVGVTTSFNTTLRIGMEIAMLGGGFAGVFLGRFPTRQVLVWGCGLGALSFLILAFTAFANADMVLLLSVFVLGVGKGLYNIGLAHLFMSMAKSSTAGLLMGAWAAFGGFAVALGGLSGGIFLDIARWFVTDLGHSYGVVFGIELVMMIVALLLIPKNVTQEPSPAA